jgi:5-methyltetrahydropteroyltriglutamate--homocysteine methyltransferase
VQDVCWGSWNGPHTNDVPLLDIAELSLRVNVSGYAPEMAHLATSRNGVFAIR